MSYGAQVLHSYPPSITVPLPPGWECKWDATTGKYFYIDHVNKKTQWNAPGANRYVKNASSHLSQTSGGIGTGAPSTSYAPSTITSRTSSSRSESVNSDDDSFGKGSRQLVANADIKRRLQLKFNANQTYQQQMISDVLVGCKNNEKEAEKRLEGMGFKMKSNNVTKPKMASPAPKAKTLTQDEKNTVLRQAKVVIGSKYTEDQIKKCAERHNYHMPAMLAEYQKTLFSTIPKNAVSMSLSASTVNPQSGSKVPPSKPKNDATTTPSPSVFVTNPVGESSASQVSRADVSNSDIWMPDNSASQFLGAKSQNERLRTRSSSDVWNGRAKGPNLSLAKGADPTLRSRSHLSINGPRTSSHKSTRSSLAKGPRVIARGPDASLSQGSSMANIALAVSL